MLVEIRIQGKVLDRKIRPLHFVLNENGLALCRDDALLWRVPLRNIASASLTPERKLFGWTWSHGMLLLVTHDGDSYSASGIDFERADLRRLVERINQGFM